MSTPTLSKMASSSSSNPKRIPSNQTDSSSLKLATRTNSSTSNSTSQYTDALQSVPSNSQETRDFVMAKRIKDSEVVGNKSNLNPLQAPFAYLDGSISLEEEVQVVASGLKNLLHRHHRMVDDSGVHESKDKERMASIERKIHQLEHSETNNPDIDELVSGDGAASPEAVRRSLEKEKENRVIMSVQHSTEPITLPNRNATWQHSNHEQYLENSKLRLIRSENSSIDENLNSNLSVEDTPAHLRNTMKPQDLTNDPKSILDAKNDKKTALMVDAFLLGYADMLYLTSSFFKDENGIRKGPLMIPLLSLCLTDITVEVFLSRKINLNHDNHITSSLNKEDLLRLATFTKNRIFRLHLEYGVGDHVLRWDMEKDTKALVVLHKKLLRRTKERLDKVKTKEAEIPRFPVLPSHFAKFRGLFKGDREILIANDNKSDKKKHFTSELSSTHNNNTSNKTSLTKESNAKEKNISSKSEKSIAEQNPPIDEQMDSSQSIHSPPLQRINSASSLTSHAESFHSLSNTLTRLSTVAFANLRSYNRSGDKNKEKDKERDKDKEKEKEKEKEREKEKEKKREKERHLIALQERTRLNQKYRDDMQLYFDSLLENVSFKEQSNKVLQFFELSPFSLLLSNEIYRKRKEGYLFIVSSASKQGWRVGHFRFHDLGEMIKRHTSKWCILGDSFLIYTSDISSTTPEEVFLLDSKIQMSVKGFSEKKNNYGGTEDSDSDSENYYNYNINENLNENDNDNDNDNENDDVDDYYFVNSKSVLKSAKSYPTIKLTNSERSIQLVAKNPRITRQWASCIRSIISETEWAKPHRFNSFAPVRHHAFAQWFVDARDYWYAASSAIEMAKDVIYIHDWWLSPELYLRRPANGNQNWRIDRLLEKKAKEGVKIFVIIYRNVGNTVVTDSMYTKHSLLDLHENIYVLRSPNQIMQNVFFWAHHEKLLIIDHSVCFLGGIDLCFGRYDTPDHVLVDDSKHAFKVESVNNNPSSSLTANTSSTPNTKNNRSSSKTPESGVTDNTSLEHHFDDSNLTDSKLSSEYDFQEQFQVFPGKDYSNPRKKDFFELTSPHEDMYDRQSVPRMPWHDVHMVTGGQVARDLSRHFIQRWNYLLRQKRPSRPTPLLVPPRPFTDEELVKLNLKGNCEVQLLRSSGDWSLGLEEHEQSIQNAYIKCIEQSEHFLYMENQFFVTSCTVESCVVKNQIGDALVDRIITAHKNGDVWKAVIVIPLMPGFEADVDTKEGGSVRLIMQCQYMSISMGETSIFARLRRVGIKPEDYINFYSLRKWGLISEKKLLTTEQLYIHAKTMIVDDRIAIIGSANINERSMRGTRDSEVCAIVRDKDLIESKMDGKPYHVGKFSHSLRVRLMREHLGVDVDLLDLVERRFSQIEKFCQTSLGINASVLKANEGKPSLSAMVELGTRYLLGLHSGTPGYCKRFGENNVKYGKKLTNEMISTFACVKTEGGNSESLDDIEFSFSFNHRAGNENAGIRSDKTLSSDTRVTTENHRNEVKGDVDGFNSKYYEEAKIQINKFLVQRVNQCSQSVDIEKEEPNDKNYPLPDFEDIVDVLSQHVIEDATSKEQNAINTDRWTMIKRLYYMKKLYCKLASNARRESKSSSEIFEDADNSFVRSRSNTNPEILKFSFKNTETSATNDINGEVLNGINTFKSAFTGTDTPSSTAYKSHTNGGDTNRNNSTPIEGRLNNLGSKKVRLPDIPLIKLKNDDINDIDKNMLPQLDFEFLDPYAFEDPLDISFYEGTWMTQAIRNTMLFQMVFHVQPDDLVQTWKDYKDFEELKSAFDTYQKIYRNGIIIGEGTNVLAEEEKEQEGRDRAGHASLDQPMDDDVVEHRRRLERSFKLAELERFQRTSGPVGTTLPGASGYGRGAVYDYQTSLRLMRMVRGHVVMFPTKWLKKEVEGSNWFYKADKIPPIQIYN